MQSNYYSRYRESAGLIQTIKRMVRFFSSEVNAAVLIFTVLQSAPTHICFCHSNQACTWLSCLVHIAGMLIFSMLLWVPLFETFLFYIIFASGKGCRQPCVYGASLMHFLLTLIRIPEIQQSKQKSILCEFVFSYFKSLFWMDPYRLCGPVLKMNLGGFLWKMCQHMSI